MNSTKGSVRARLLTSTLLAGLASVAAPLAITAVATAVPTLASAQDYTSGALAGTVLDGSGAPIAGAAVTVKSNAQGFTRSFTTDGSGQFRSPALPAGTYTVSISKDGFQPTTDGALNVKAGGEAGYNFTLASADSTVSEVVVTATANPQLDFSQTTTGLSIDVEELQKQVPIGRNITALTLLAPGTVEGSSTNFRGQTSISGASVAENAFFLNGLNITNFDNYIGASTVPFEFYKSVEVKTGGYAAEYGRATGGIVNAVSKSGSNDFTFAVHGNWSPNSLGEAQKDTYQTRGKLREVENKDVVFEVGGPIIEDRLFFYGLAQLRDNKSVNASKAAGSINTDVARDPFYGLKLDGYITDRQHLEFTLIDTQRVTKRSSRAYTYSATGTADTYGAVLPGTRFEDGATSYVAKYTGSFTDWLTLSAAYGLNKDRNATKSALTGSPLVQSSIRAGSPAATATRRVSFQNTASQDAPRTTTREFYRADADIYVSLLGDHHIRAGFDREDLTLIHQSQRNGGGNYVYREGSATDPRGVAAGRYYLDVRTFIGGGSYTARNQAIYLQDSWDVLPNLTLNLGVRRDQFQNRGIDVGGVKGGVFVDFDNEIAFRLGATWDPTNDGTNKIFANYGRYYLPVATNTSYRQASAILDQSSFFLLPAGFQLYVPGTTTVNTAQVNPISGLPLSGIGTQITGFANSAICLPGGVGTAGVRGCTVRNNGTIQPFVSNISRDLKSTADDEYILGYEHRFDSLWKAGATLTFRKSLRAADDVSVDYAVQAYCKEKGIAGCEDVFSGFHQYTIINPGLAQTIVLSDPLPGETAVRTITFSAEQLKYPKVDRQYIALQMQFDRAFDGKWALNGSYTLSESKGNYEGYVKTDYAGGQTDAGITADFDTPGLTEGAYGLLPNHRAHVLKLYGSYQVTDSFLVGANGLVTSGRKYGCMGFNPNDPILNSAYGALSHYCNGVSSPRGSVFSDPWTYRLDLSARYTVPSFGFLPENGLTLRADVFNVFNTRKTVETNEFGELDSGAVNVNYRAPLAYMTPRSVRLGFDLVF
ncbi:TonB-dependent receptor [Caulobacter henricii]|uniref:TonB-dependent receptor n=1 Tax=Caulobacter henricii TaxID=69395 RepID=A0A0P0P3X8_9CAUL|nr:TonB-dependent receptor [Caulobacter henricii]ALL15342.1 TonB-dependent receptor [Caulobacter henricii]